ncbi:hypothetical protein Taro_027598 [Colocasia esculenta]|uniref:Uncharacterized protein n=1 Tax=Colocasia esculenta TaxID=4460 RepID=A0A843VIJ1_COLES|nr:hypothetical protein [Colocasia esculenta]
MCVDTTKLCVDTTCIVFKLDFWDSDLVSTPLGSVSTPLEIPKHTQPNTSNPGHRQTTQQSKQP